MDVHAGILHIYLPQDRIDTPIILGEPVGCIAPGLEGVLVVALQSGFARYSLPTRELTHLLNPEKHLPGNRFNDGKCDPAGRFLAGTMDNAEKASSGCLYSYSPTGKLKTLLTGLRISNGLAWSPDQRVFYHIDTPSRQVTAFDYDGKTGEIANPRQAVDIPSELGWPDGMTSDAEGMLWVAMWGGGRLTRWNPANGQLLEQVPVPALNVTSCIFGGPSLTDLYITTARQAMSAAQLDKYPLSGGLFRARTGIQGMPTFTFGG